MVKTTMKIQTNRQLVDLSWNWSALRVVFKTSRAESKTVLGKAQYPRVKASQGVYYSGFINQTNKQTNP